MANDKLTKKDVALGGKIKCEGCGAEWWVSGPQALGHLKDGWPTKCGNNPAFDIPGSRNDCLDESEMTFIPYDIEENVRIFREFGQHDVADAIPEQCARILAAVDE